MTQSRYMPPWPASNLGVALQHPLSLSDADIATIVDWSRSGAPLDVDPSTPVKPAPEAIAPPRHDEELRLSEPYQATPTEPNDYRCFELDPQLAQPAVVTGYQFLPDQIEIVHHALVYRLSASSKQNIEATDAADPGPGWQCFGGINVRGTSLSASGSGGGSDLVMGYAPARRPRSTRQAPDWF